MDLSTGTLGHIEPYLYQTILNADYEFRVVQLGSIPTVFFLPHLQLGHTRGFITTSTTKHVNKYQPHQRPTKTTVKSSKIRMHRFLQIISLPGNLLVISDARMLDATCGEAVSPQQIDHGLHRFPRIARRREVPGDDDTGGFLGAN